VVGTPVAHHLKFSSLEDQSCYVISVVF